MKRFWGIAALLAVIGAGMVSRSAAVPVATEPQQKNSEQARSLAGQILTKDDAPVNGAVVYLKNTKTLAMKSFISESDGAYRFHSLSPNVDYEVWAEYQGTRSGTKTVSSFDSRSQVTLNIHIDVKK